MLADDLLVKRGPQGGNLNNPNQHPERRREAFSGGPDLALHRGPEYQDAARMGLGKEQAWHRMAAFMLLAGRTNSEIAMAANVTVAAVSTVRGQRWFQELLATLANEHGQDLMGLLQSEAQASLNKMIEIRDSIPENPSIAADRLSYQAAKDIFELAHGKATQTVVSTVSHSTHASPSEEMESIQQQLAALRSSATPQPKVIDLIPA